MFELAHGCVGQSLILKPCSCGTCYYNYLHGVKKNMTDIAQP